MTDWNRLKEELRRYFDVDKITDLLGMPIEEGIKPLVVALNYKGFATTGSCEGHPLREWEQQMQEKVDEGQARLVCRAERGLTYETDRDGRKITQTFHESPWVDLRLSKSQVMKLINTIRSHSDRTRIDWRIKEFSRPIDHYRISVIPRYDLKEMQADIPRLAEDILRM